MSYTLASFFAATSPAIAEAPEPTTAASSVHPVCAAIACPAAIVSHETRFNFPSRCSTMTRIVSVIESVLCMRRRGKPRLYENVWQRRGLPRLALPSCSSNYAQFILQLLHQLLRHFRWRPFQKFCIFRFLRHIQLLDLLQIPAHRRLHLGQCHLAQRLRLGLFDPDQRRVAQLVNSRLNRQHRRQWHVDKLKEPRLQFPLDSNTAISFFNLHDDGRVG